MKKILLILITGLLWCSVGNAGINEPGTDQQCFDLFEKKTLLGKPGKDIIKAALQ